MTEHKIYIMTKEDKEFKTLSEKIIAEMEARGQSQENITFDVLVEQSLEINHITREELERRFDEITAFGFNVRKVPKFSCLLPYHIMYSDWTPENYRADRIELFKKYDKDASYIISMGLCSQEFNTVSDRAIERFLRLTDTFERGKKKVLDALEKTHREQKEIEETLNKEMERLQRETAPVKRALERQQLKIETLELKNALKVAKKQNFMRKVKNLFPTFSKGLAFSRI